MRGRLLIDASNEQGAPEISKGSIERDLQRQQRGSQQERGSLNMDFMVYVEIVVKREAKQRKSSAYRCLYRRGLAERI